LDVASFSVPSFLSPSGNWVARSASHLSLAVIVCAAALAPLAHDARSHVLPSLRPGKLPARKLPARRFEDGARQVSLKGRLRRDRVGQGIGGATLSAGEAGAAVAILDLDPAPPKSRRSAAGPRYRRRGLPLDVTSSRDVDRVAAELERRHAAWTCS